MDPATVTAITGFIASATGIITALLPLIILVIGMFKKEETAAVEAYTDGVKVSKDGDDDDDKAGAGLIGVALLAALYFGTQSKAKQKK
jgi:hypothetical protein